MLMESIWFPSLLASLTPQMLPTHETVVLFLRSWTAQGQPKQMRPFSLLQRWLRSFGYLPRASRQMSSMQSTQMLTRAVSRMQRFYGLEVTGQLNAATIT